MLQSRRWIAVAIVACLALLVLFADFLLPHRKLDALGLVQQIKNPSHQDSNIVDWHRFAYVQYVTNLPYLCNSVMLFESLHRLGCKPDRLMMFPSHFSLEDNSTEALLLRKAREEYSVILSPIEVQRRQGNDRKSHHELFLVVYSKRKY